ncbi:type II toxin-antitoxin system RelE/ParE family toxin [Acidisoma cladoniae]|uniref:type II toxin-antitoxin system RelE/ParE family toxin n=1 Tax=Acidisoma cladoniae TaxID=3040935 RepID=UPI00255095BD|nr:type II toxin-antitoxin system RelE/ParE family toxin [Acidisoma sp. PAMC 29798]
MTDIVWTEPALANLQAIRDYIQQFNPYAAVTVAADLIATGNGLINFPYRGRPVRGTSMREVASCYPYIIRYRISGEDLVILRIRHASRRQTIP